MGVISFQLSVIRDMISVVSGGKRGGIGNLGEHFPCYYTSTIIRGRLSVIEVYSAQKVSFSFHSSINESE